MQENILLGICCSPCPTSSIPWTKEVSTSSSSSGTAASSSYSTDNTGYGLRANGWGLSLARGAFSRWSCLHWGEGRGSSSFCSSRCSATTALRMFPFIVILLMLEVEPCTPPITCGDSDIFLGCGPHKGELEWGTDEALGCLYCIICWLYCLFWQTWGGLIGMFCNY